MLANSLRAEADSNLVDPSTCQKHSWHGRTLRSTGFEKRGQIGTRICATKPLARIPLGRERVRICLGLGHAYTAYARASTSPSEDLHVTLFEPAALRRGRQCGAHAGDAWQAPAVGNAPPGMRLAFAVASVGRHGGYRVCHC
jgi:hypothetical protein